MNLAKEKLIEILTGYKHTFLWNMHDIEYVEQDLEEILYLVHDILLAEAEATEKKEPFATRSIDRMRDVAYDLSYLACSVDEVLCGD